MELPLMPLSPRRRLVGEQPAAERDDMVANTAAEHSPEVDLAALARLSRYRGTSRAHTESDLRVFFTWCQDRQLSPLAAQRNDLELYVRWLQDIRRFEPSTVSRRVSVVAGFYRTCVIDGVLVHSPADYVRRPTVPPESPTLGLTHLQFEAMLTAARESTNPLDFALVCLLGPLGLRIFEAVGTSIDDLGEEHGHRVLLVRGKGGKAAPLPRRHRWRTAPANASAHAQAHLRHHHARRRGRPTRRPDRGPARRPLHHHAVRPSRKNLDRDANNILAAYMASGT